MARMIQNPDGSYTIIAEPGDDEPRYDINPPGLPVRTPQPGDTLRDGTPATTGGTMSGNPFGTPVSQLALDMAVRNQQTAERIPAMTANQRALLNRRLTRYGGDLSQYENVMDVGYDPAANALRSQAESMRDYLVGMPELMAKAAEEGKTSGITYKAPDILTPFDLARQEQKARDIAQARDSVPTMIGQPAYDTARPRTPVRPPAASRLRPVRTGGAPVSFR